MKVFLSWVGASLVVFAIIAIASNSWNLLFPPPPPGGLDFTMVFSYVASLGFLLMLIGGFSKLLIDGEKPRYSWSILIVLGLLYIASFYGYIDSWLGRIRENQLNHLLVVVPGFVVVIGGLLLRWLPVRERNRLESS